jgi:hypothetical protein
LLLYGEWIEEQVLAPVPHRQYVFTMPRLLRPLFARRRERLGELCRIAARLLADAYAEALPGPSETGRTQQYAAALHRHRTPMTGGLNFLLSLFLSLKCIFAIQAF